VEFAGLAERAPFFANLKSGLLLRIAQRSKPSKRAKLLKL
jgi:hypothetical protein